MVNVDARGLSCPQPILMTKKAVEKKPESLTVTVDNETAKNNVLRFLNSSGYTVSIVEDGEDLQLIAKTN